MLFAVLTAFAASPPAVPPTSIAAIRATAWVVRGDEHFWARSRDVLHNGDVITFHVTSEEDGFVSLLDYAPSGFVTTHCAPGVSCGGIAVQPGVEVIIGPFRIEGDNGWETFDLVLTRIDVKPRDLQRFAVVPGTGTASEAGKSTGSSSVGLHSWVDTLRRNRPDVVKEWVTFFLEHKPKDVSGAGAPGR